MQYTNPNLSEETKMALTEIEKQFISMRSSGSSIRKIAKKLNKSTRTICLWNKKFYRNIVEINSNEFNEFRNKIIKFKKAHLDFLIDEFENVKLAMAKSGMLKRKSDWDYEGYLKTIMKIAKLVEKFESDLLISSDSLKKIDESQIIDANSEDFEILSDENKIEIVKQKNKEIKEISGKKNENTFTELQKINEIAENYENNKNEIIENTEAINRNDNKTKVI